MDAETSPQVVSVLVADSEPACSAIQRAHLERAGWQVVTVRTGAEVLSLLARRSFDAAVVDLRLPDLHGLDVLNQALASHPGMPTVATAANPDVRMAVEAMQAGAVDFLEKPIAPDGLPGRLGEWLPVAAGPEAASVRLGTFASVEPGVAAMLREATVLAGCGAPVAVCGAPGTGRRFLARQIHDASDCSRGACHIVEAGLHAPDRVREQLQSAAEAGRTVIVADAQNLKSAEQDVLLRWVYEGPDKMPRLIVTLSDVPERLAEGGVLDRRLADGLGAAVLSLPPLAARKADIPLLVDRILAQVVDGAKLRVAPTTLRVLREYDWPGNVRQLRLVLERAARLARGKRLETRHLPILQAVGRDPVPADWGSGSVDLQAIVEDVERTLVAAAMARTDQNQAKAAVLLGIPRTTLRDKLEKYGLTGSGSGGAPPGAAGAAERPSA